MGSTSVSKLVAESRILAKASTIGALEMTSAAKTSHIGSCLSVTDILSACLVIKSEFAPESEVLLSKGHAAAVLYAALYELGKLDGTETKDFCSNGSSIYGHVNHFASTWIPLSTGSLGHGFPFALGIALGKKKKELNGNVYVIISDGECNEGTTWESALIANKLNLTNLRVIIDRNKIQSLGGTEEILPLEPLREKWEAFGWSSWHIDGHNTEVLIRALLEPSMKPVCIIADTIKGHGVDFMENKLEWHYKALSQVELLDAISQIQSKYSS